MDVLVGKVITIRFRNADNGYTVLRLASPDFHDEITVTLMNFIIREGDKVRLEGQWVTHPKYGKQFNANSCEIQQDNSIEAVEQLLSSGIIPGVGKAMAKRIIDAFGKEALEALKDADKLTTVRGIGKKTAQKIVDTYLQQHELSEVTLWLTKRGLSGVHALNLYRKYGSNVISLLNDNAYLLIKEIKGFGFKRADALALQMGIQKNDYARMAAGIHYLMNTMNSYGHCCVERVYFLNQLSSLLEVAAEDIAIVLHDLIDQGQFVSEDYRGEEMLYPDYLYRAEDTVARKLLEIQDEAQLLNNCDSSSFIDNYELANQIQLGEKQREAIMSSIQHGVLVLTGGPGTGKTTVIKAILSLLQNQHLNVKLAAPTGRAAKRMTEATGCEALTIHRLLEVGEGSEDDFAFGRDDQEPLEADVIIIDEASMIDIVLMYNLLRAIPSGARLVLVGDIDQLPAVGAGLVLKDIIQSDMIPTVRLDLVFRQGDTSSIVVNAHLINQGKLPQINQEYDFQFYTTDNDEEMVDDILECYRKLSQDYDIFRDIQVLTPMHKQLCGVDNLNKVLQDTLNPKYFGATEYRYGQQLFRIGDKVMHIKNNYQKNVFNGDVGYISNIYNDTVYVNYLDREVEYSQGELSELKLAYAISVHKSQGSEYKVVILPLSTSHYIMLQRNLLYTAITRAKEMVILIGSSKALNRAVFTNNTQKRYTLLAQRLRKDVD